jgi:hypothetical protein
MALPGEPEGEARPGYATTVDQDVQWHWNSFFFAGAGDSP